MSAHTKKYIIRDYTQRLEGLDDALVISIRGVNAIDNNAMRNALAEKQIKVTVVRNNLARHAFKESLLGNASPLLKGPSAFAYGGQSVVDVARELIKWAEKLEHLELKGAVLDGQIFEGKAGVEKLSKMPTREEALSQAVTLILSPGGKLVSQLKGPGSTLASILKSIEEKLEKGETIAKSA
ncbi:MAG: 50S ribosomal protein L10 [Phycisphaerales bacterium]|nr:MAG: 50S ribosomal protein L10 [Phycisphaerales bacterium]